MKETESIKVSEIPQVLKRRGVRMDHFLHNIGISRIHFFLIRKGKRPLIADRKKKIETFLKIKIDQ